METKYLFLLNGIEIDEPISWDAVDVTMQRDSDFHGMVNMVSDNQKFWGQAATLIKEEYESNGVEGQMTYVIKYSCDGGLTYQTLFPGILNFTTYRIENNEVSIKIEPSGFHRLVKNRLDTPINLNSNTSIDGLQMSTIDPFDLGLHSKAITEVSIMASPDGITTSQAVNVSNSELGLSFPLTFQIKTDEIGGLTPFTSFPSVVPDLADPFFTAPKTGSYTFEINVDGSFQDTYDQNREYTLVLAYRINTSATSIINYGHFTIGAGTFTKVLNVQDTQTFNLSLGDTVSYYLALSSYISTTDSTDPVYTLVLNDGSFLKVTNESKENPSSTKALLLHEAFAKLAESMTGIQDSFRSDFFGRTNSEPHQYDLDGCGAWTAVTNGLNIRKLLDKNGQLFPIVTSFNDLYTSCDAVWNLGMKIEVDGTGKEFIRVEPKEYFYNAASILNVFQVSDLSQYPAKDYLFSTYKTGYEKWNLNITGSNAIDEYNSERNYLLPGKMVNNGFNKLSKYIASGYLIEQTRRVQYQFAPSNDFETDNDMFFICTNRTRLTSDLYTVPPEPVIYDAGTISERNENFTGIDKVLNSDTVYNLRISPARMAVNWYKYVAATIFKHPTSTIKFTNGTGNYQELDTMINDCIVIDSISQDQNLIASDINGVNKNIIFIPEYLEFTYPLSQNEFLTVLANSDMAIGVSCGANRNFIGFIKTLTYGPTANGGIGKFILTRGACIPGDFNNDFNNDYNIGNCN